MIVFTGLWHLKDQYLHKPPTPNQCLLTAFFRLYIYFRIIINKTRMIIRTNIIVSCLLSFAFLAIVPKLFLALSSLV
jgi:hypothetical protein